MIARAGPRIAALLLGVVAVAWAAAPLLGAGWPGFALTVAACCVAAGSLRLALQDVPEPQEAFFLSAPERVARTALGIVRRLSWEEIGCAALLWLEVLHPARPWHTAVLGALLVAWLLTVHVAESGARPGGLLRRQAKILIAGACLLALGAAAAFLPGTTSGAGAALHVLAAMAVIAAAVLVLPGLFRHITQKAASEPTLHTGSTDKSPHIARLRVPQYAESVFERLWLLVDHHWRSLQEAGLRRSVKCMEPGAETPADVLGEVRSYWDADAETYDQAADHYPSRPQEVAAWAAALRRLLPEPPLKVLDVGAGTGFLSLLLASQGYQVTAADLSPGMLDRLRAKATVRGLAIQVVEADAEHPPVDDFGAVVERHLMWTLPSPAKALAAWHSVAPTGRLVLIEGTWGTRGASPAELMRQRARQLARSIQPPRHAHHDEYSQRLKSALPHADGLTPDELVTLVEASSWGKAGRARIERLRDVEWAMTDGMGLLDAIIGPQPRWAVIAGR